MIGSNTRNEDCPPGAYAVNGDTTVPTAWESTDSGVRGLKGPGHPRTPIPAAVNAAAPIRASSRYRSRPESSPAVETSAAGSGTVWAGAIFESESAGIGPGPRSVVVPSPGVGVGEGTADADALGNAPTPVSEAGDSEAMGGTSIVGTGTMGVPL
ncbi:hypothetical protein GCM10020255_043630 [Rhodococcus baikonurensis]